MSTTTARTKKLIRKILSEDIKTIIVFLLLIVTVWNVYIMILGWIAGTGAGFNTPSISEQKRSRPHLPDADGDLLPDIIELAPDGQVVIDPLVGDELGRGTGTNPNKMDSDGDLFTDSAEDSLGSDARNWFDPGWIWIVWGLAISYFVYENFFKREDRLKEYKEFEDLQASGGVSKEGSKFAYGSGSSIFSAKKASDLTEEEKKQAIQQDARFARMTMDAPTEVPKKKRKINYQKIALRVFLGVFITVVIIFVNQA